MNIKQYIESLPEELTSKIKSLAEARQVVILSVADKEDKINSITSMKEQYSEAISNAKNVVSSSEDSSEIESYEEMIAAGEIALKQYDEHIHTLQEQITLLKMDSAVDRIEQEYLERFVSKVGHNKKTLQKAIEVGAMMNLLQEVGMSTGDWLSGFLEDSVTPENVIVQ